MLTRIIRIAVLFAISASLSLFGQGLTGTITGNVADQSGSPIPGAEITLNNVGTGQNRTGQSGTATVQLDLGTGVGGVSPLSAVGTTSQTVTVPVGATEVRFPLSATALGVAKIAMLTASSDELVRIAELLT